jgi:ankyrin repeat protein
VLLTNGYIDRHFKDKDGRDPLSWALANGHAEISKLLVAVDGTKMSRELNDSQASLPRGSGMGENSASASGKSTLNNGDIDACHF